MILIFINMLFSLKIWGDSAICNNVHEPKRHDVKWNGCRKTNYYKISLICLKMLTRNRLERWQPEMSRKQMRRCVLKNEVTAIQDE